MVVRIGILGAAKAAPTVVIRPARGMAGADIVAVAARDVDRARRYAGRHGIPLVHESYQSLVDDPDVDAVYVPLVNSLHAGWTLRCLAAGKHVLVEKPFAANEFEARAVAAVSGGRVVMEGLHYRYHPLAARMWEISRELGEIRHVAVAVCYPAPGQRYELAGGSMMEAGCYAVHCLRLLGPGEPDVVSARAWVGRPNVDRAMVADLVFPGGATGRVTSSVWSRRVFDLSARVVGAKGEMRVSNFMMPRMFHRLRIIRPHGTEWVPVDTSESTHVHQLRAFVAAVADGGPVLTPPADSVASMRVIDEIYRAAGLPLRQDPAPGLVDPAEHRLDHPGA